MLGEDGSLGDLGDTALDPLANAGERQKFGSGSLIIVVVVVLGLGGLWLMRNVSNVSGMSGGNSEIDKAIQNFVKGLRGKSGDPGALGSDAGALAVLSESYTKRQVPLDSVARDPFKMHGDLKWLPPTTGGSSKAGDQKAEFEAAAAKFELKSVIMSADPLANLSGKIVRKGSEVLSPEDGIPFKITDITATSVTVVAEDTVTGVTVTAVVTLKR